MTDRFGRPFVSEDEDIDPSYFLKSIITKRFCAILIILYILFYIIGKQLTASSEEASIPISSSEARLVCETKNIETESGIHAGYLTYGNTEKLQIQLYTVSITRTITCVDTAMGTHVFQYKDDYLNISTVNVDKVYASLLIEYPIGKSFIAWYYAKHCSYLNRRLDRNCLSKEAIEPEEYIDLLHPSIYTITLHSTIIALLVMVIYIHFMINWAGGYKRAIFILKSSFSSVNS